MFAVCLKTFAVAALLCCGALAAAEPGAEPGCPMMAHHGTGKWHEKAAARWAQHQQALHEKLALSTEQESAWQAFTQAMQAPASAAGVRPDPEEMKQLTTPERLQRMGAHRRHYARLMEERMDAREAAMLSFYRQLTPAQQKIFDTEAFPPHGRPRGGEKQHAEHPH